MSAIDILNEINRKCRYGDKKQISIITGISRSEISIYLKYAGIATLNPYKVKKIIDAYQIIKNN